MAAPSGGNSLIFQILIQARDEVTQVLGGIRGRFIAWVASLTASFATLKQILEINREMESLRRSLDAITGSQEATAAALSRISEIADRTGQSVMGLARQYASFAASARGTALEGDQAMAVFEAVSGAMGTLGASTETTERAFIALGQMMSKGQVMAEEWRGQLSEALPVANEALSRATGLTVKQLNAMMAAGNLLAADTLPALAKGLTQLGLVADKPLETLGASFGRLGTAATDLALSLGEAGLNAVFRGVANSATWAVDQADEVVRKMTAATVAAGNHVALIAAGITGQIGSLEEFSKEWTRILDDGNKYVYGQKNAQEESKKTTLALQDMAAAALKTASDYTTLSDAAKKNLDLASDQAKAIEEQGKARQDLAKLSGDLVQGMQAEKTAAEQGAVAQRKKAEASDALAKETQTYIGKLQDQIEKLKQVQTADTENAAQIQKSIDQKGKEIERQNQILAQQQAVTEAAKALAEQQRLAALQAELTASTYGDQSAKLGDLRDAMETTRANVANLEQAEADGKRASEELVKVREELATLSEKRATLSLDEKFRLAELTWQEEKLSALSADGADAAGRLAAARERAALAAARYRDAQSDAVEAARAEVSVVSRNIDVIQREGDARSTHLRNLADEARARGDLAEAARLERKASENDIQTLQLTAAMRRQSVEAIYRETDALIAKAKIDGLISAEERQAIDASEAAANARLDEADATDELVRHLQELQKTQNLQTGANQGTKDSTDDLTASANEAAGATEKLGGGMSAAAFFMEAMRAALKKATDGLREYSTEAADAVQGIIDSYDSFYNKIDRIAALRNEMGSLFDTSDIADTRRELASLTTALEDTRQEIQDLYERAQSPIFGQGMFAPIDKAVMEITRLKEQAIEAEIAHKNLELRTESMTDSLDSLADAFDRGALSLPEYTRQLEFLQSKYQTLGEERLQDLRDALADAKARTDALRDSAQSALEAALSAAQEAGLGNTERERELIRYQQTQADLERQLAEARAADDAEAIARLERAIELQKQAHEARLRQLEEELKGQKAITDERAKPAGNGSYLPAQVTPSTGGTGGNAGLFGATQTTVNQGLSAEDFTRLVDRMASAFASRPVVLEADGEALARLVTTQQSRLSARRA